MSTLFSVSKLLGKSRSRSIKRVAGSASVSSLVGDKDTSAPKSLGSSKLSTVVTADIPSYPPKGPQSNKADSIVEVLSSDNESMSSFYGTPLAENVSVLPQKPERGGDGKDEHGEEPGYAMVSPPKAEKAEEWTQLDLNGHKGEDIAMVKAAAIQEERERATEELEATTRKYDEELRLRAEERDRAQERVREAEAELKTAQDELHIRSKAISTFMDDVQRLSTQIATLEADKKLLQTEVEHEQDTGAEEAARLQGIITLEGTKHMQEVADLAEQVAQLTSKIEKQDSRIARLEEQLAESQDEARDVYAQNYELETKLLRQEESAAKAQTEGEDKEMQIAMLDKSHDHVASQLLDVQNSLTAMERQNRMLIDQLRQQSSEMSSAKGLRRPPSTLTDRMGRAIGGTGSNRLDSAVRVIKILNDEIYQTAASMTDQLEGISMGISARFVAGDERRAALAANLKSVLGTELVKSLGRGASVLEGDNNTFLIQMQTALQGCLIACCMRIITSWYPTEWEYGTFLVALFERIRGTDGPEKALQWRKTALKNCVPPANLNEKLVGLFVEEINKIFALCGWENERKLTDMIERFTPKLSEIATLAIRLNKWTAAGVFGEAECIIAEPGLIFDSNQMANDDDFRRSDRRRSTRNVPPNEQVICTVGLGIQLARNVDEEEDQLLLKPKVALYGALF